MTLVQTLMSTMPMGEEIAAYVALQVNAIAAPYGWSAAAPPVAAPAADPVIHSAPCRHEHLLAEEMIEIP